MIAGAEAVHVEAHARSHGTGGEKRFGHQKVLGRRQFEVEARARHGAHAKPCMFGNRRIVGEARITRGAMGAQDLFEVETLRGLRQADALARQRCVDAIQGEAL